LILYTSLRGPTKVDPAGELLLPGTTGAQELRMIDGVFMTVNSQAPAWPDRAAPPKGGAECEIAEGEAMRCAWRATR
jgi:hypothetical protein